MYFKDVAKCTHTHDKMLMCTSSPTNVCRVPMYVIVFVYRNTVLLPLQKICTLLLLKRQRLGCAKELKYCFRVHVHYFDLCRKPLHRSMGRSHRIFCRNIPQCWIANLVGLGIKIAQLSQTLIKITTRIITNP